MKKSNLYVYITAALALLVPVPGRFAYGLVLMIALNVFMLAGTLFKRLVFVLHLDDMLQLLIAVLLVSLSIIFKQVLILVSPVMALVIGYVIYMPAVSSFLIGYLYHKTELSLFAELSYNMKQSLIFSAFALLIFFFRDIFGYGTITLPSKSGLAFITLGSFYKSTGIGVFWASIPGALVLTALCIVAVSFITRSVEQSRQGSLAGHTGGAQDGHNEPVVGENQHRTGGAD